VKLEVFPFKPRRIEMKHLLAISSATAVLAAVSSLALAQSDSMKGMDMKGTDMKMEKKNSASGQVHKGTGKVTKVDPAGGSVTIAHEPVSTMNWPAMTMTFKAKDKKLLEKVKQGEKVEFEFIQQGKDYIVTAVK
jgi:Cu(I)/Ag(I) efflux system periplasmic protein CusF